MYKLKKFSRILVAIDGSPQSIEAAEHGISMAKKDNADLIVMSVIHTIYTETSHPMEVKDLIVMSVIHTPASILIYATEKNFREFLKKCKEDTDNWFDTIRKKATEVGVPLRTETVEEIYSIPGAIIKYAEQEKADVIVVGGTGRSGFKKLLLGSVSGDVVRYARCPVMVVK